MKRSAKKSKANNSLRKSKINRLKGGESCHHLPPMEQIQCDKRQMEMEENKKMLKLKKKQLIDLTKFYERQKNTLGKDKYTTHIANENKINELKADIRELENKIQNMNGGSKSKSRKSKTQKRNRKH